MTITERLKSEDKIYKKYDSMKRRWRLLPYEVLQQVVDIFDFGAEKYGVDNWKKCDDWDRYFDAMMRHIIAWRTGEINDIESGKHHLAHVICNAWFLIWADNNKVKNERV